MSDITLDNATKQPFLHLLRSLVQTYHAFSRYDTIGHKKHGLTPSQADVIFTLGNTCGLTFKEIGELTLITKGTLTGVVERLQEKGLVKREQHFNDRRSSIVSLSNAGDSLFKEAFPSHIAYVKKAFDGLSEVEQQQTVALLNKLSNQFDIQADKCESDAPVKTNNTAFG